MSTSPGGGAMTVRYHRDAEAARLKLEVVRRPVAWRIHPAEVERFAAEGKHCEMRKCRNPVTVCTWRWWRSTEVGKVLVSEHFVCDGHGASFAQRHHIGIDPPSEREARRLREAETAELAAEGRHCAGCENPATWVFVERYTMRGKPRADEDLSCDGHVGMFADRFQVSIDPAPDEDGAR